MAEFLEELLPIRVRLGASIEEDFAVEIVTTAGGSEYRRLLHALPRYRWRITYKLLRAQIGSQIQSLHRRAHGRYAGFRVACLDDRSTHADGVSAPTPLDHPLPRLSAGVYQLVKRYGVGGTPIGLGYPTRTLFKPVAGSVVVAKNSVQIVSGVTVDTTNGRVTISPAPLITDVVTGGCLFDLPARFDSALQVSAVGGDVRDTGEIDLIELINP